MLDQENSSFIGANDFEKTPRGSIHTNINFNNDIDNGP